MFFNLVNLQTSGLNRVRSYRFPADKLPKFTVGEATAGERPNAFDLI